MGRMKYGTPEGGQVVSQPQTADIQSPLQGDPPSPPKKEKEKEKEKSDKSK